MSSPNLRVLVRKDGVIRRLIKDSKIKLAVRAVDKGKPNSLPSIFEAFHREGKLPAGFTHIEESPEIEFVEEFSEKIAWNYDDVRKNFTSDCQRLILDHGRQTFSAQHFDFLTNAIQEEAERDKGLGRIFLQGRLPDLLHEEGILDRNQAFEFLARCTDAVYLSNLPRTIGLDPIYAAEHRESFMLLRGGSYTLEDFGDPFDLKPRLTHKHLAEGLNMLDVEDIEYLHQTDAYKAYRSLSGADDPVSTFDDLFVAYGELNRTIEDRIIQRFRGLVAHSPAPDPRHLSRQYGNWLSRGTDALLDVLSIALPSATGVPLGWAANLMVDTVKQKIDPERKHVDAAMHDLEKSRLALYLKHAGNDREIEFEHEVTETDGFNREIIVQ